MSFSDPDVPFTQMTDKEIVNHLKEMAGKF
jgi:hypothetical protein